MLTRAGVAKRLGKSIATVRRLEGHELFPTVDERGVRRFSQDEVDRVRETLRSGGSLYAAQGRWLHGARYTPTRSRRAAPQKRDDVAERIAAAKLSVANTIIDIVGERRLARFAPELVEYLEELVAEADGSGP